MYAQLKMLTQLNKQYPPYASVGAGVPDRKLVFNYGLYHTGISAPHEKTLLTLVLHNYILNIYSVDIELIDTLHLHSLYPLVVLKRPPSILLSNIKYTHTDTLLTGYLALDGM